MTGRAAVVAALLLAATGCRFFGGGAADVGSCLTRDVDEEGEVTFATVDCARPHDLQVVGVIDARELGSDYPGDAELSRWAFSRCVEAFEEYLDEPYGRSVLDLDVSAPGQDRWRSGPREVQCAVGLPDGRQLEAPRRD